MSKVRLLYNVPLSKAGTDSERIWGAKFGHSSSERLRERDGLGQRLEIVRFGIQHYVIVELSIVTRRY